MTDLPLLDDELLVFALLKRDLPESVTVGAELDIDSIDHLPLVTFGSVGGNPVSNGPGLWSIPITFRVFAEGQDATWELCRDLHEAVMNWALPGVANAEGIGQVHAVSVVSKFSRDATVDMQGKNVNQYSGSFELIVRNN